MSLTEGPLSCEGSFSLARSVVTSSLCAFGSTFFCGVHPAPQSPVRFEDSPGRGVLHVMDLVLQALYMVLQPMYLGIGAPYPSSEVTDLGSAKLEGILKSLGLTLLHLSYLASQELHILGAILALVEYASITVQQQVRLLLLPEGLGATAHGNNGASRRGFLTQVGI